MRYRFLKPEPISTDDIMIFAGFHGGYLWLHYKTEAKLSIKDSKLLMTIEDVSVIVYRFDLEDIEKSIHVVFAELFLLESRA